MPASVPVTAASELANRLLPPGLRARFTPVLFDRLPREVTRFYGHLAADFGPLGPTNTAEGRQRRMADREGDAPRPVHYPGGAGADAIAQVIVEVDPRRNTLSIQETLLDETPLTPCFHYDLLQAHRTGALVERDRAQ